MGRKSKGNVNLSIRQKTLLEAELKKRTILSQYKARIPVVLRSYEGESQAAISLSSALDYETVRLWRNRWIDAYDELLAYEKGVGGKGVKDHELMSKMLAIFSDKPRSGAPRVITAAQEDLLTALACESPQDYGIIRTNWSHETLAQMAIKKGIFERISPRYVGKLLKKEQVTTA
jgi:putative transposase